MVTFQKTSSGRETLRRSVTPPRAKGSFSKSSTPDADVGVYTYKGDQIYRRRVQVGTKKGYYSLTVEASSADNPVLSRILTSVRVNAQKLISDSDGEAPPAADSVIVSELPDSEIVRAVYRGKSANKVRHERAGKDYGEPDEDVDVVYSRPLLIVEQPFARFTDEARTNNVQGEVRLLIHFKADGLVEKIVVLKGLPFGLTEQAIRAASQIKFVPAEVAGKPADSQATQEYTFAIY
jgi:TonB family protein